MSSRKSRGKKRMPKHATSTNNNMLTEQILSLQQSSAFGCHAEDNGITQNNESMNSPNRNGTFDHQPNVENYTPPIRERHYQPFTVVCDKELVCKVKAIAKQEGLRINAVVQAMYEEGIRCYEEKHGILGTEIKKKNAKDVLFST